MMARVVHGRMLWWRMSFSLFGPLHPFGHAAATRYESGAIVTPQSVKQQDGALNMEWNFLLFWVPMMMTAVLIVVGIAWFQHRSRSKALDMLRVYADKGEEPPAAVVEALDALAAWGPGPKPRNAPTPKPTRTDHLTHVAGSVVISLGSGWVAWWRMPDDGEPGTLVIIAVIVAIFFAGAAAARLVAALGTPSSGRSGDER